ncbi:MAG: uridine kinase [Anaerolineales bacterium]
MKGDIIIVEEHHRRAAEQIVPRLLPRIQAHATRYTITVAGESGSGKSETAKALAEALEPHGIQSVIYQQDDYFIHPPKTNDATRRQDISWVGSNEVKLALLDEHLQAARDGAATVTKPLVIYEEDRVDEETISLEGAQVVIAEGTYTSLLENVDTRIFIARNRLETMEARKKRGREAPDPFIEDVLKIEHEIISKHRERADVIITRDYDVEFVTL